MFKLASQLEQLAVDGDLDADALRAIMKQFAKEYGSDATQALIAMV